MSHKTNKEKMIYSDGKSDGFNKARMKMFEMIASISSLKETFELAEDIKSKVLKILKNYVDDITLIYDENNQNLVHLLIEENKFLVLKVVVEAYYLELDKDTFYEWFTMESNEGLTPLDLCSQKGNEEIINYMFEIISKTDEKILKLDIKRNSVFHNAALKNKLYPILFFYEKLQMYFPNMKIIDNPNQFNITPLHYACYQKNIQVADLLLNLGANINAQDIEGKNVLTYAVCSNSTRLVKKLLLRGADKTLKDKNNKTAYDFAIEKDNLRIARILENKNCFSKCFCNQLEFGSIRSIRNDIKTSYFFIVYYTFVSYFFLTSKFQKNTDNTKELYNFFYNALMISIGIALTCSTVAFLLFVYFTVIHRRYSNAKIKLNMENTLIELYTKSKSICIKCRRTMNDQTLHCLVCDMCVDKWDHHCFWLNTCIDSSNKKLFQAFLCLLLIGVIVNMFFSALYISGYALNIFNTDPKENYYIKIGLWAFFLFVFSYIFIFVYLPLLCNSSNQEDANMTGSEFDTQLINRSNQEKTSFSL